MLALYAVKVRAEAMQKASDVVPSGMLSVIGRPQAQYKYACLQARDYCKTAGMNEPVCSVANYLFPDGRVIAGHQKVSSPDKYPSFSFFLTKRFLRLAVSSGSRFPPAELQTASVPEDQTSACQRCFPHRADAVSC